MKFMLFILVSLLTTFFSLLFSLMKVVNRYTEALTEKLNSETANTTRIFEHALVAYRNITVSNANLLVESKIYSEGLKDSKSRFCAEENGRDFLEKINYLLRDKIDPQIHNLRWVLGRLKRGNLKLHQLENLKEQLLFIRNSFKKKINDAVIIVKSSYMAHNYNFSRMIVECYHHN